MPLLVNSLAEAEKLAPKAIKAVKPDGRLWIAYANGTAKVKTDVNRDRLWQALEPTGWRPVRMVALDDMWSSDSPVAWARSLGHGTSPADLGTARVSAVSPEALPL